MAIALTDDAEVIEALEQFRSVKLAAEWLGVTRRCIYHRTERMRARGIKTPKLPTGRRYRITKENAA